MLTRRQMLRTLGSVGAVAAVAATSTPYGYLSPDECRRRGLDPRKATVLLNGQDVTARTLALHDVEGWIEVHTELPGGRGKFANPGHNSLARHREYGRVEVRFKA